MKKLLIIALLVHGICNASVFGMNQEIILEEFYSIVPLDDSQEMDKGGRPDPNRFCATIEGRQLFIEADTREPIYIEVVSKKSGEVVATREFIGSSAILIPQSGAYTLRLYSGNSVFAGEFVVE